MADFVTWTKRLQSASDAFARFAPDDRPVKFRIEPPCSRTALDEAQSRIPEPIPAPLINLFLKCSGAVYFLWLIDEARLELPLPLREVVFGGCEWDLEMLQYLCGYWFVPDNVIRSPECRFDFRSLFPFMTITNGDMLLLVREGPRTGQIVYLAHEGAHGYRLDDDLLPVLAPSLEAFLDPWIALGCPGPELWCLAPFLDAESRQLSLGGENAIVWRELVGLG